MEVIRRVTCALHQVAGEVPLLDDTEEVIGSVRVSPTSVTPVSADFHAVGSGQGGQVSS
jgi:hypothetical protein